MMLRNWFVLSVTTIVLVGCNSKPSTDDAEADDTNAETVADDQASTRLKLPDGLDQEMVDAYNSVSGEPSGRELTMLASISQVVASGLVQQQDDRADDFFLQTDQLIQQAVAAGMEVPPQAMASVSYNAASVHLIRGNTEEATKRLQKAVESGFKVADLQRDTRMTKLLETDGFDAKLAKWEAVAQEKVRAHAIEDLANGETFPFDFELKGINGDPISVQQHKGKVLIVDVWGTWCGPCMAELPSFIKLQEQYGPKGLQIIGLNYERGQNEKQNQQLVQKVVTQTGINYPCALGTEQIQQQIPDFGSFPTTLIIDRSGKVRLKAVGLHEYEYLEAIVKTLLEE